MPDRLQLSVVLRQEHGTREMLLRAAEYEQAGIDAIGVPEAYGIDAVSQLGWLAARTDRVRLVAQILPVFTRTPTLIAMTAAGLDEVSGGRFVLGIGASGPQVIEGWHGVRYDAPLSRTREVMDICRTIWRRERLTHAGPRYRIPLDGEARPLKLISSPARSRVPIYLAALGEQNVQLAAELADGWLPFLYWPERADSVWAAPLAAGRARRATGLPPLEVCAGGPFAIAPEPQMLRDATRARLALYIGGMGSAGRNFYNRIAQRYGFADEAALVQERYLAGDRRGAEAAVPAALVDGLSLIGGESYLRDRLEAFAASGVTVVQLDPVGADPVGELRRLRELVEDIRVAA